MRSPVERNKEMGLVTLDEGLKVYCCPESGGIFLPIQNYTSWLSKRDRVSPKLPADEVVVGGVEDNKEAKICPESGHIMSRFKVGHDFSFNLDRSPTGSIWLDKGEWEKLKERHYHDELISIFSVSWQNQVIREHQEGGEKELLKGKLGEEFYEELRLLREKLHAHPHTSLALAFLGRKA